VHALHERPLVTHIRGESFSRFRAVIGYRKISLSCFGTNVPFSLTAFHALAVQFLCCFSFLFQAFRYTMSDIRSSAFRSSMYDLRCAMYGFSVFGFLKLECLKRTPSTSMVEIGGKPVLWLALEN